MLRNQEPRISCEVRYADAKPPINGPASNAASVTFRTRSSSMAIAHERGIETQMEAKAQREATAQREAKAESV